jgi:hypothetical protein
VALTWPESGFRGPDWPVSKNKDRGASYGANPQSGSPPVHQVIHKSVHTRRTIYGAPPSTGASGGIWTATSASGAAVIGSDGAFSLRASTANGMASAWIAPATT